MGKFQTGLEIVVSLDMCLGLGWFEIGLDLSWCGEVSDWCRHLGYLGLGWFKNGLDMSEEFPQTDLEIYLDVGWVLTGLEVCPRFLGGIRLAKVYAIHFNSNNSI